MAKTFSILAEERIDERKKKHAQKQIDGSLIYSVINSENGDEQN